MPEIAAVIVTHHPDPGITARAQQIAAQVDRLIIVDNDSGAVTVERLRATGALIMANATNRGLATALNQAAQWAGDHGYRWLLCFDQDTQAQDNLAAELLRLATATPDRLGIIGANYQASLPGAPDWMETGAVITSGSLLSLAAYRVAGPFRDDFFIDSVDIEYCLRLRAHGYRILQSRQQLMKHAIGDPTTHRLLWKHVVCSNHSPARRYYITRNRLVVARQYWRRQPRWAWIHARRLFNHCVLALIFEREKLAKLKAIGRGVADAMRGRMGPLPP